jgi:hypothetical protein
MNETKPATTASTSQAQHPNPAAAQELAKSKETRDKILAEHKEREKWMPTPTQAENDAAAMGHPVAEKKPDGSPVELTPEQQQKQMEAAKKPGGGYQTKAA